MRDVCSRLRRHCGLSEPPFGLRPITKFLHARVERGTDLKGKLRGVLERRESGYVIRVDRRQNWRSLRFTIAHELGHILLIESLAEHREALRNVSDPRYWSEVEKLCDLAANELLVPVDDLWSCLHPDAIQTFRANTLLTLYNRYLVPYSALFKRLLDVEVSAVMLWRYTPDAETNTEWRLRKVFHNQEHFIPLGISAEHHLYPNPLTGFAENLQAYDQKNVELRLRNKVIVGKAVSVAYSRPQTVPLFEGFSVPEDADISFDAVTLIQFDKT